MTDGITREESLRSFRKYLRIDAALFIASMVGAFTLSGFAHLEKFYLTLDVPIDRVNISAQQFVAYGAVGFGSFLAALVFAMALVGTVTLLLVLFEKPGNDTGKSAIVPKWMADARDRAVENRGAFVVVGAICILAFLLMSAWYLLVRVPSNAGRAAALELASECIIRQVVYANLDQYEGCQVAESDDMLYLLKRHHADSMSVEFHTLELPKSGLKSVTGQVQKFTFKK
ncbi:hypothetical protein P3C24_14905 [Pseudomonas proteolytica]|uniref:hypothetical protein n=1 Tax=Pseudomonas proteolytica TaxID=219574 RepID=UPI0023DF4D2F|nr:hypothetical protein [Pseudomonas proteolytica]MDF3162245.1 hypothetical protein [Pseudomonas proteolytica]